MPKLGKKGSGASDSTNVNTLLNKHNKIYRRNFKNGMPIREKSIRTNNLKK